MHAEYQLNVELGDVLVNLHAGLAEIFPQPRTGYYGAVGHRVRVQRRRRGGVLSDRAALRRRCATSAGAGSPTGCGAPPSATRPRCWRAGVAFFAFLSMFPALAALVSIYGLLADPEDVARQVDAFAGALARPTSGRAIHDQMAKLTARSTGTLSIEAAIGIVAAIWAATKGMKALITGLSLAFGQRETRGFIRLNVTAFLFTLGSIVVGVIAIAAIIVLPVVLSFFHLSRLGEAVIRWLRWPMLTVVVLGRAQRGLPIRAGPPAAAAALGDAGLAGGDGALAGRLGDLLLGRVGHHQDRPGRRLAGGDHHPPHLVPAVGLRRDPGRRAGRRGIAREKTLHGAHDQPAPERGARDP